MYPIMLADAEQNGDITKQEHWDAYNFDCKISNVYSAHNPISLAEFLEDADADIPLEEDAA